MQLLPTQLLTKNAPTRLLSSCNNLLKPNKLLQRNNHVHGVQHSIVQSSFHALRKTWSIFPLVEHAVRIPLSVRRKASFTWLGFAHFKSILFFLDFYPQTRRTHGPFDAIRAQLQVQSFGTHAERAACLGPSWDAKSIYFRLGFERLPAIQSAGS